MRTLRIDLNLNYKVLLIIFIIEIFEVILIVIIDFVFVNNNLCLENVF